jgi:PDDEXK-like domain of unknown function (DUF3799)
VIEPGIYRRGECDYDTIEAVNISSLLWMAKSAKHYKAQPRKDTKPLCLGTSAHCATLEPDRFDTDFAAWDRRSESGRLAPRNGKHWDAFRAVHTGQSLITEDERLESLAIAAAVRSDELCAEVLRSGDAEVAIVWVHERTGMLCKGRIDWLDIAKRLRFADLKTAADITHDVFMVKCAKYHYHTRMAWYGDGLCQAIGADPMRLETLLMAVESSYPNDCAVYEMPEEVLLTGRDEYEDLMSKLQMAKDFDRWPGCANGARMKYTLPRWAVKDPEDDIDPDVDWGKSSQVDE